MPSCSSIAPFAVRVAGAHKKGELALPLVSQTIIDSMRKKAPPHAVGVGAFELCGGKAFSAHLLPSQKMPTEGKSDKEFVVPGWYVEAIEEDKGPANMTLDWETFKIGDLNVSIPFLINSVAVPANGRLKRKLQEGPIEPRKRGR